MYLRKATQIPSPCFSCNEAEAISLPRQIHHGPRGWLGPCGCLFVRFVSGFGCFDMNIYTYIYIYRERWLYIYITIQLYICIYIYMYMYIVRSSTCAGGLGWMGSCYDSGVEEGLTCCQPCRRLKVQETLCSIGLEFRV